MKILKFEDWLVVLESQSQSQSSSSGSSSSPELINQLVTNLKKSEGEKFEVYTDSKGIPTIGVGFNLNRSNAGEKLKSVGANYELIKQGKAKLNQKQVDTLLRQDIDSALKSAQQVVSNFINLPDNVKLVIVDMIFNLGRAGFSKFENFINYVQKNDFVKASQEMLRSSWAKQVGQRAQNLSNLIKSHL